MKESGEIKIELVAAFKGLTFLPNPLTIGLNNANPKLILKKEQIEFRNLLFTTKKTYSQIEEVDVYINSFKLFGISTTNICLTFKDSIFTFVGNLNNMARLIELVTYFRDKGIVLTERAKKTINKENVA